MRRPARTEMLLVLACAAGAAALGASQFMDTFHLTPPGGEALEAVTSREQHGYALLVLAVFSLMLLLFSLVAPRSQAPGQGISLVQITYFGIAVCGVVGLLLFLLVDLPDVNQIGTVDDARESFIDAKAEPQAGFWLELVGSVTLAVCGIALATLRGGQLRVATEPRDQREAEGARAEQIKDVARPAK